MEIPRVQNLVYFVPNGTNKMKERNKLANRNEKTTLVTQVAELQRVYDEAHALVSGYLGIDRKDVPLVAEFDSNGQRRGEALAQFLVRVTNKDRKNRKGTLADTIEYNGLKIHDRYAVGLASLIGPIIYIFKDAKNAQAAGMDSEMVARDTFDGIVTRRQSYWGQIPRAIVDKIPLLQWDKDDKCGAVVSLSQEGIDWVDNELKPNPVVLQWARVPETPEESKESTPKFKYTCLCESDGKPRTMTVPFQHNSTCNDCQTDWALVTA